MTVGQGGDLGSHAPPPAVADPQSRRALLRSRTDQGTVGIRDAHACGCPDKLTTAGCASGLRTIWAINDRTQAVEEHGPSTSAAPVQLRRDFCNGPNTNHQDLWDRADQT